MNNECIDALADIVLRSRDWQNSGSANRVAGAQKSMKGADALWWNSNPDRRATFRRPTTYFIGSRSERQLQIEMSQ
jgi:hypothetical protein